MSLLEKVKVNIAYLLGKADKSLYAPKYKSPNLSLKDWKTRWDKFSDNGCGFVWYGVDSNGNIAEFVSEESYVPEIFFNDESHNKRLQDYFGKLPSLYESALPTNIRAILRKQAETDAECSPIKMWIPLKEAKRGIFIFGEAGDSDWFNNETFKHSIYKKNPQELLAIPKDGLRFQGLPNDIKELLEPYQFENLAFKDCQFLDISKYFYCEE